MELAHLVSPRLDCLGRLRFSENINCIKQQLGVLSERRSAQARLYIGVLLCLKTLQNVNHVDANFLNIVSPFHDK